jgi:L,D-peptidoglycan transpeptidase YkuD (ErfK/YbiS/YcfS/YnhG family)
MVKHIPTRQLFVSTLSRRERTGVLRCGNLSFPCALGRTGARVLKREGDGATPLGTFRLRQAYYRADKTGRPRTQLPLRRLRPDDGWCDAACDRNYNRIVRHPYPASAEHLWRKDGLYDLIVVLGYNDRPRIAGRGSAVFLHVAKPGLEPTEGCVALRRADLLRLLPLLSAGATLTVLS